MALKDLLTPQDKPHQKRWIDEMEETLSKEDFDWLIVCIQDERQFSGSYIANIMTKLGHTVSPTTINETRRRLRA